MHIRVGSLAVILAAMLMMSGMAGAQGSSSKVDPNISKISSAYEAAANAEDLAKLSALYTADAVEMPPNAPAIRGRSAIEAYYKKEFADGDGKASIKPTESAISGNIAYEVGTYSQTMKMKTGQTMSDVGKYIVLMKQGPDKQWKIAYLIYNGDNPPPAPQPSQGRK